MKWTIFSNLVRFLCKFRSHLVLPGVPKKFLEPPLSLFLHAFLEPPGVTRLLKTVLRDFQSELGILLRLFGPPGATRLPKAIFADHRTVPASSCVFRATWCYQASHSSFRRPPEIAVPGAGAGDGQSGGQSQMPSGQMLKQDEVLRSFDCNMQWAVTTSDDKCIGYSLAIVVSRHLAMLAAFCACEFQEDSGSKLPWPALHQLRPRAQPQWRLMWQR